MHQVSDWWWRRASSPSYFSNGTFLRVCKVIFCKIFYLLVMIDSAIRLIGCSYNRKNLCCKAQGGRQNFGIRRFVIVIQMWDTDSTFKRLLGFSLQKHEVWIEVPGATFRMTFHSVISAMKPVRGQILVYLTGENAQKAIAGWDGEIDFKPEFHYNWLQMSLRLMKKCFTKIFGMIKPPLSATKVGKY